MVSIREETEFSTWSVPRSYLEDNWADKVVKKKKKARMEAGSNTSTVALLVVGGDEKRTQCLGGIAGQPCYWGI
jgi:hypothetical protein